MPGSLDHRRRALVFWTATGLIAVDTVLFTMVVPALPEFADRYGFSTTVAALIFAAFPVGQLITALGSVGFVERAGRRPAMIVAAVLLAGATLAFALSVGVASLALARLVQGARRGPGVDRRPGGDLRHHPGRPAAASAWAWPRPPVGASA